MKRSAKIRLGMVTAIAGAVTSFVAPASAVSPGWFSLAGTGTISPCITMSPSSQTLTFAGNGVIYSARATGQISCSMGGSAYGSTTQGSGNLYGTCNTPCGTSGISMTFTWTASGTTAQGSFTSGCLDGTRFHSQCGWVFSSLPTATSYTWGCGFEFD
ncbi:MAG: hypothetical protein QOC82_534 [Frankiaceae bacterium]|jgi:hypothetical protein|nr:hypothetical protein [Frankiaceae bacterium]